MPAFILSIVPWRIALTWQFEREEPRGAMLRPRLLSGLFVCLFPGIGCRCSSFCSWVFSPALFLILSIPPDAIRHLPHPLVPLPLCPSPHLGPCFYSAGCYPASPASLHEPITPTTLPFLTGLLHSHPRFYSPGMGSEVPLLISPVVPPSPTLAQIIVCGIISAFSTTGCLYIFFIIIIVCFVNFQRTSFLVD